MGSLLLSGCTIYRYQFDLDAVEVRGAESGIGAFGQISTRPLTLGAVYEDARLRMTWKRDQVALILRIENKTNATITMDWHRAALVGASGQSYRLIPGNKLFSGDAAGGPYLAIAPHARFEELLLAPHALPDDVTSTRDETLSRAQMGKAVRVQLPLEILGKQYLYNVTLKIIGDVH